MSCGCRDGRYARDYSDRDYYCYCCLRCGRCALRCRRCDGCDRNESFAAARVGCSRFQPPLSERDVPWRPSGCEHGGITMNMPVASLIGRIDKVMKMVHVLIYLDNIGAEVDQ